MSNRISNRQSDQKRALRLEPLESRELLSTIGGSDPHVAEVSRAVPALHVVLAGTMSGRAILSPTSPTKGTDAFDTSGDVIGPSIFYGSVAYSANKSHAIKYTKGVGTLANASGDQVYVVYTGTGHLVGTSFDFSVKGSVKGGAGSDAKAAGTFSGNGTQSALTGDFSINMKIILKRL